MKQHIALLLSLLFVLCSCATQNGGDAATALQGRREYEMVKYRDPKTGRIPENIRQREQEFSRALEALRKHTLPKYTDELQAELWERRGPWNIGGRTRALALDTLNENIIVAGAVSGGVWRSEDAGQTWTKSTRPEQLHSVTCIVQDRRPGHTNDWYMGTGEAYGNSAQISGNGIWKSTDGARSWEPLASTLSPAIQSNNDFAYTWRVVVPLTENRTVILVASALRGILRSVDGGTTWTRVLQSNSYFSDLIRTSDSTLYATLSSFDGSSNGVAIRSGVFMSTDHGATWTDITPPDLTKPFNRIVLGVVHQDPSQMFAIAETPGKGTKSLFILRDGTREEWHSLWKRSKGSWKNLSQNIPLFGGRNGDYFSQGGYDMFISVSPGDTSYVLLGGTNLYRSTDGFTSTSNSSWIGGYGVPKPNELFPSTLNHHPDQHDALFLPSNSNTFLSANDGGVMRTDSAVATTVPWTDLNRGYLTTQFYTVAIVDKANDPQVMGGMQDNGTWATRSTQLQDFWVRRNGGDGSFCAFADTGRTLIVSTQSARVRRVLLDATGNEIARTRVDPIGATNYMFINPLTLDKRDERIMYLPAGSMMWRNNNLSGIPLGSDDSTTVNWDSLPTTRITSGQISFVLSSSSPDRIVYYGTTNGRLFKLTGAHVGQPIPEEITDAGMPKSAMLNSIVEDPSNPNHLMVCFSNYGVVSIYASNDGGDSWNPVSGNLEDSPTGGGNGPAVNSVSIMPYNGSTNLYFAATSIGMFFTTQLNGQSTIWSRVAADVIGNVPCDMVVTRPSDKLIVVGSHGNGVFSGTITSLPPATSPVTLLSPPDDTRGVLTDTTVTWNPSPNAGLYTVEVARSADFTTNYVAYDGIKTTSMRIPNLQQGPIRYYWRVIAFGQSGRSTPSETWTFSTAIVPPILVSPKLGDTAVLGNPVWLTWTRVPGAISYDIQVSTTLTFNPVVSAQTNIADTTVGINGLESNRRYYWRARARDNDAAGVYSVRTSFITGTLTSVHNDAESEDQAVTVTPNPVRDRTSVSFTPSTTGLATLALVDETGKTHHRFSDVRVESVLTTIDLDCTGVASGRYTLVITQGRNQIMVPLLVVR